MRRLGLLLLVGLGLFGAEDTVYQKLFTDVNGPITTDPIRNVGQDSHYLFIVYTNAPAHVCTFPKGIAYIEGSFDNSLWIDIGLNPKGTVSTYTYRMGTGAFPYVRVRLVSFNNVDCVATGWYSGRKGTINYGMVQGVLPRTAVDDGSANPVLMGANTNGFIYPITQCLLGPSLNIYVESGTISALAYASDSQTRIRFCNFVLTADADNTVATFIQGTGVNCTTDPWTIGTFHLKAGVPLSVGNGLGSSFLVEQGKNICLSAAGGNVTGMFNYTITTW